MAGCRSRQGERPRSLEVRLLPLVLVGAVLGPLAGCAADSREDCQQQTRCPAPKPQPILY